MKAMLLRFVSTSVFLVPFMFLGSASVSVAQVLNPVVVDNFNYALADGTNLNGAAGTGTGESGSWIATANAAPYTQANYTTTTLNAGFNYLPSAGGSLSILGNGFTTASIRLSVTSASSTVYGSFLFNSAKVGGSMATAEWVLVGSAAGAHDNSSQYYGAQPIAFNSSQAVPILNGGGGLTSASNAGLTNAATTYLDLYYVTGLGTTTETTTNWILTASQYNTLLAANGNNLSLAVLNGAASSSFTAVASRSSATNNPTLSNTQYLTIGVYNSYGNSGPLLVSNVELGTSGFSVPEPSLPGLVAAGLLGLLGFRKLVQSGSRPARAVSSRSV